MARVTTYLNFQDNTMEAFELYRSVFGGEFSALMRMGDMANPDLPEADRDKVMHIALPILGCHELMGTDFLASMGHELTLGNNISIALHLDSVDEATPIYEGLAAGGPDDQPLFPAPWGGHFGMCVDPFGIRWMFNIAPA